MAQHDYIISNQTFPNTRADINNLASAIATNNSGTSAPTTQYAGQFWIDTTTTTWTLYIHDGTDDIQFATIDTSANTVNFTDSALDVVTDLTPQLGGNLDLNSNDITGTGNINITGTATVTGLTTTGDINLGDNDKANFGATPTLELYSDGSNSWIKESGAGGLYIGGTNLNVMDSTFAEYLITGVTNGAITLFYDNNAKLTTTSSGIDVTGKTTTDSIDAVGGQSGSTPIVKIENSVGDNLISFKRTTGTPSDEYAIGADSASLHFKNETLSNYIMSLSEGGDISFYEDTGTTPKLFWDASEERLGIGTASPQTPLHIYRNSAGTSNIRLENTESYISIRADNDSGIIDANTHIFKSKDGSTEYMRIDSSGNVGIGTSSPSKLLHINSSTSISASDTYDEVLRLDNTSGKGTNSGIGISFYQGANERARISNLYMGTGQGLAFHVRQDGQALTEAMRIDSSGRVGIGTTSPSSLDSAGDNLVVGSGSGDNGITVYSGASSASSLFFADGTGTASERADAYIQYSHSSQTLVFANGGGSERMRIDSSGRVGIGTTSMSANFEVSTSGNFNTQTSVIIKNSDTSPFGGEYIVFQDGNGTAGSISSGGSGSVAYNTSSDYRLKENVVEMTGATDRLKQLSPKRFNFIADANKTVDGFLAHEVSDIVPEAITGTKDEVDADGNPVYQGIDQSKLVPLLVATIKELEARITALENA